MRAALTRHEQMVKFLTINFQDLGIKNIKSKSKIDDKLVGLICREMSN